MKKLDYEEICWQIENCTITYTLGILLKALDVALKRNLVKNNKEAIRKAINKRIDEYKEK